MSIPISKLKQTKYYQTEAIAAGENAEQKEEFVVALANTPAKHITMMIKSKTAMLAD